MKPERTVYRKVEFLALGRNLPQETMDKLSMDDRQLIKNRIETFRQVQYLRDYKPYKLFSYKNESIKQLTIGNYRLYFEFFTKEGQQIAVVCYICRKKGREANKKDLKRVVTNIRKARATY